jgi:hypothetical protein
MPIFTDLVNKGRTNAQSPGIIDSRDWFREKAQMVRQVNTNTLINAHKEYNKAVVLPGFMYCFTYDAKYKDTLPYYDRFPLIFPFKMEADSFLGMNMHYLPLMYRARLMDALYGVATNQRFDDKTRLRISYDLLNSSAKYKYFEPCVKRYLKSHVKSRFLMIPSNEWDIALFLPMERFTINKNKVYQDSMNKIRGINT